MEYNAGKTNRVRQLEETSPPMTTAARGVLDFAAWSCCEKHRRRAERGDEAVMSTGR